MAQAQALRSRARQPAQPSRVRLQDLYGWLHNPHLRHDRLCIMNFMPEKLEHANVNVANQTNFSALGTILLQDDQVNLIFSTKQMYPQAF